MKERPILFSGPMVKALLAGVKTQTRRVVKPQPPHSCHYAKTGTGLICFGPNGERVCIDADTLETMPCPFGVPGDRLWVKERFGAFIGSGTESTIADATYAVLSDGSQVERDGTVYPGLKEYAPGAFWFKWRPSIHMPRWASRLTLEVTHIRVERVQDITERDAKAEGFRDDSIRSAREHFLATFYDLNERAPRGSNPWVWVVDFKVMRGGKP